MLAFFLDFFELAFIIVPLLGPVAEKLGIDLIWFGVLLGVNMQTSFMHPPFGFALFYLRSVAPAKDYLDRVTGAATAPVTTGQIYWGAVPFVLIQVIMVGADHRVPEPRRRRSAHQGEGRHPERCRIEVPPIEAGRARRRIGRRRRGAGRRAAKALERVDGRLRQGRRQGRREAAGDEEVAGPAGRKADGAPGDARQARRRAALPRPCDRGGCSTVDFFWPAAAAWRS